MTKIQRAYTGTIYRFKAEADLDNGQSVTFHIEVMAGNEQAAIDTAEFLIAWPLISFKLEDTWTLVHEGDTSWLCPVCQKPPSERLNIQKEHYQVCHDCQTCWWDGKGRYSDWIHETLGVWEKNVDTINSYRDVEPILSKTNQGGPDRH